MSEPKLCECGCGQPAPIATRECRRWGYKKGEPKPFVQGHYDQHAATERFWTKVDRRGPDECWLWLAGTITAGYGSFSAGRNHYFAHRWSYERAKGPIPQGLQIDHLCRNRGCVNPAHLEAVTSRENTMRGDNFAAAYARKTHCPQGHPYDVVNTKVDRGGHRQCRECVRARNRATALRRTHERRLARAQAA